MWLWQLERRVCGCMCCLICVGPILVVLGLVFLLSATSDTRGDLINEYNVAVDAWTDTHRANFEKALFRFGNSTNGPLSFMKQDTSADTLNDHDKDIHTYNYLKYTAVLSDAITPKPWLANSKGSLVFWPADTNSSRSVPFTDNPTLMSDTIYTAKDLQCSPSTSTTSSGSTDCNSACNQKGGTWNYATSICTVHSYLSQYCLKVDNNWNPSNIYGGLGCTPSTSWSTSTYVHTFNPTIIAFTGTVTVRSANDPYIVAEHLTGGSLNFGLTRAQKAEIGIILIITGGAFLLPVVLITYFVVRYYKRKHHHHHAYAPIQTGQYNYYH